jgi:sugar/nucleoside kinase (ribokinase family)
MKLLVVGSLAFDSVQTPAGQRDEALGGSANFLATAASYFCQVGMVGVVGDDFPDEHIQFYRSRGIDTAGITCLPGKTFRWSGTYGTNLNEAKTLDTQLNVLDQFDANVPPHFIDSDYVVLGNISPELQSRVLDQMSGPKLVAADTMNFWIDGNREQLLKTLKRVNLISINDGEARMLSGEHNLLKAARAITQMGPRIVVIKRGEHGATVFTHSGIFSAPAFPVDRVVDPTGAGDSFAGGLMGYLTRQDSTEAPVLRQGIILGSTLASFAVEDFSLDRFRSLELNHIKDRFAAFKKLTHFSTDDTGL